MIFTIWVQNLHFENLLQVKKNTFGKINFDQIREKSFYLMGETW